MKYKVYTSKIKLDVVNEYLVTKKLKTIDIKTKYQLSTRSLIYNWLKKIKKNKLTKANFKNKNLKIENEKLINSLLK